ncbi:PLP-dependent aminotransferase family protein [Gammaproteobacteria bacterium AS21]
MGTENKNNLVNTSAQPLLPSRAQPNYLTIAQKIEKNIADGKLIAGQKLGSIRQLAKSEAVSINTIRAALDSLVQSNRISSVPRIGFVVNQCDHNNSNDLYEHFIPDSRLAETSQRWLKAMVLGQRSSIAFFHMAVPTDTKIFKSFQRQYRQVINQSIHRENDSAKGLNSLRQIISEHLAQRQCNINSSDIQITNGCQHAIEHALRTLCKPGDTIAIPVPAFPGYFALLGVLGLKAVEVPMSPQGPDPEILQQVMADKNVKALLIQPNCHNPTGITLSDEYKQQIAGWANQYHMPIIEDDITAQLSFSGQAASLIANYDSQGWCLIVSSISKIIGDSERIGWCCPGRFKTQYMTQFAVSQISNSYFLQQTLARYYQGSLYQSQLRQWRLEVKIATTAIALYLQNALTDSISMTPSTGGYSLWIKLPPQLSAQQLHQQIDKSKIDFLSGELFSLEMRFKQFIRLIIMPALNEKTYAGIDHLISVIKKHTD